jgi:hypothetical protein
LLTSSVEHPPNGARDAGGGAADVEFETIRGDEGYEWGWGSGVGRGGKVICGGSIFCGTANCHIDKSRIRARKRRERTVDLSLHWT